MTVQELINELEKIPNKSLDVICDLDMNETGGVITSVSAFWSEDCDVGQVTLS